MHDVFAHATFAARSPADFKIQHMILFPPAWKAFRLPTKLDWKLIPFSSSN
jgi:hypothetical protein